MRERQPAVYIMASQRNGTVNTGVTSALVARVWQHKNLRRGFAGETNCTLLVWYELHSDMASAIAREKQIKGGSRKKKLALIEAENPQWRDLWRDILDGAE